MEAFSDAGVIGVFCVFAILVIQNVLSFVKNKDKDIVQDSLLKKVEVIEKQTQDLWTWHNKEDDEGVKIWYVRKSLEEAITRLATAIEQMSDRDKEQNLILAAMAQQLEHIKSQQSIQ